MYSLFEIILLVVCCTLMAVVGIVEIFAYKYRAITWFRAGPKIFSRTVLFMDASTAMITAGELAEFFAKIDEGTRLKHLGPQVVEETPTSGEFIMLARMAQSNSDIMHGFVIINRVWGGVAIVGRIRLTVVAALIFVPPLLYASFAPFGVWWRSLIALIFIPFILLFTRYIYHSQVKRYNKLADFLEGTGKGKTF
jgi:hypothetical protein